MSPGPVSETTLQDGLRDIRLPSDAPGGALSELAAALALACLAAVVLAGLWRLAGRATPRRRTGWRAALASLPTDETARRTALLHLLKAHAPDRFAALRPALYVPGATPDAAAPDSAALESELRRHG